MAGKFNIRRFKDAADYTKNFIIREEIDKAFGEPVCDKVCCGSSPVALSDGLPVWMNFLMAVIDEIDANMPEGEKRSRARVQQYMDKYNTKYAKYMKK